MIMLDNIPSNNVNKKLRLYFFHAILTFPLINALNRFKSKLFKDLKNSSYMPVIIAMVPPETPGLYACF